MPRDRDHTSRTGGNRSLPTPRAGTGRGSIDIREFSPPGRSSRIDSRVLVSAVCALASSLLHVAFLTTAIWGGSREKIPHQPEGLIASRGQAADEIALQWVTID